jgi:hypothetical protein
MVGFLLGIQGAFAAWASVGVGQFWTSIGETIRLVLVMGLFGSLSWLCFRQVAKSHSAQSPNNLSFRGRWQLPGLVVGLVGVSASVAIVVFTAYGNRFNGLSIFSGTLLSTLIFNLFLYMRSGQSREPDKNQT